MTAETSSDILRFDAFEIDRANRQLRRDGAEIELGNRYFDALVLLVEERGTLVTKDRFMDRVWHGIPVTDEALTQCIRTLRKALGDDAANPRFIATVPKHGYRFIAAPLAAMEARDLAPSTTAGACTLAGGASGVLAGFLYAAIAGTGSAADLLVLAAMIGALGLLAGAGTGLGMAAAMAWRGRTDAAMVAGGALGGLLIGALGSLLGREGIAFVTGSTVSGVTGPVEGLLLGTAAGMAGWIAVRSSRPAIALALAAVAGAVAGAVVHLVGGTLLGGSLHAVAEAQPGMRLSLPHLAPGAGDAVRLLTATAEGTGFAASLAAAVTFARKTVDRTTTFVDFR